MQDKNRLIRLVKRPEGQLTPDIFDVDEDSRPNVSEGQFLLRNIYLSMDPALVGRMRAESNYAESVNPGEVMHAYGIGQVVESKHPDVKLGEFRFGRVDMQCYSLQANAAAFMRVNSGLAKLTWYLGAIGITGATAYFALLDIGKPRAGETVLISSGASSVGSIAAQIAKNMGCRTVAIVSTEAKAQRVRDEWFYDGAVSYRGKSVDQLSEDIAHTCPQGVDVYFDNTSGDISEAVMDQYNDQARIVVVGRVAISHLADTREDVGRRDNNLLIAKRIKKQGFLILDYQSRIKGASLRLARWLKEGKLRASEDILDGIDQAPNAFFRMLNGESEGKQLVKLADPNMAADPSPRWLGRLLVSRIFPTSLLAKKITRGI